MEEQQTDLLNRIQEIAQTIGSSTGPNLGIFRYDTPRFRDELIDVFVGELPDFQHIVLELAPTHVTDLEEVLKDKMPPEILESSEVKWVLHIINLEVSLYQHIWTGEDVFLHHLAEIAPILNTQFPFISLLYIGRPLSKELTEKAPEFIAAAPLQEDFAEEGDGQNEETIEKVIDLKRQYDEAIEKDNTAALTRIIGAFGQLMYVAKRNSWAYELLEEALSYRADAASPSDVAKALFAKGLCLLVWEGEEMEEEEQEDPFELINEAIDIYEEEDNQLELGGAYYFLGQLYEEQVNDSKQALRYYEAALSAAEQANDTDHIQLAHRNLGILQNRLGDLKASAFHYGKTAEYLFQKGETYKAAKAFQHQGASLQDQLKWADAKASYQRALDLAKQVDDDFLIDALTDSIQDMAEKSKPKPKKRRGLFGRR